MDKERLLKLLHKKIYWEKERDECFAWVFRNLFFHSFIFIRIFFDKPFLFSRIENETSSLRILFVILDLIILSFYLFIYFCFVTFYFRIEKCSKKLAKINQELLKEVDKIPKN